MTWAKPRRGSAIADAMAEGDDLVVRFRSNPQRAYRYPGLGGELDNLLGADSPGKFLAGLPKVGEE